MIEFDDLSMLGLHIVAITGMYDILGRNMCQDLSELFWFYIFYITNSFYGINYWYLKKN